jgi:ribosomal protein L12E/L44/L45/RPP1/RPP2
MIFISDETRLSGVFFLALVKPTAGDPMIKLIASALLSVGIATAAMAADMPKSAAPMAADTAAAAGTNAPAKPAKSKHSKKSKKSTPAPSTAK